MENRNIPYKIYLDEADMPQAWYNLRADMKNKPAPLLNPGTGYLSGVQRRQDDRLHPLRRRACAEHRHAPESPRHGIRKRYDNSSRGYKSRGRCCFMGFSD